MLHSPAQRQKHLDLFVSKRKQKSLLDIWPPQKKKKKDEVWRGGGKVRKTRQYVRREAQHKAGRYFSCNVIPSDLASLILFFFFPIFFLLSCFMPFTSKLLCRAVMPHLCKGRGGGLGCDRIWEVSGFGIRLVFWELNPRIWEQHRATMTKTT